MRKIEIVPVPSQEVYILANLDRWEEARTILEVRCQQTFLGILGIFPRGSDTTDASPMVSAQAMKLLPPPDSQIKTPQHFPIKSPIP